VEHVELSHHVSRGACGRIRETTGQVPSSQLSTANVVEALHEGPLSAARDDAKLVRMSSDDHSEHLSWLSRSKTSIWHEYLAA
jgi:hypothetical protein